VSGKAIVAIRPEPGLSQTLRNGALAGLEIAGVPLFEVRPVEWNAPDPATLDALLLGSANAVMLAGGGLGAFTHLPVHAVGERTAEAARKAGFSVATSGSGGLQQVLEGLAGQHLRLLRLAGAEHVPLSPPPGIEIVDRIVYEAAPLAMPDGLASLLNEGAVVLLHSAAAARHFAKECDRLGLSRCRIALAALGPRIAEAAGEGWAASQFCKQPQDVALLALARDMCH
jgi:uroporphyrinogen-III synthase